MTKRLKILVLAPHTDDAEFGCGGSMSKWLREGHELAIIAFSNAASSRLSDEMKASMGIYGVKEDNFKVLSYPTREFPRHRQSILEDMVYAEREYKPDLVVLPASTDTHQDHKVIAEEGFRAFKKHSIIGYEMPHNNITFRTNMFVILNPADLTTKVWVLGKYQSQKDRGYADLTYIKSLAKVRGTQIGAEFAEVFEVIRWVT